MRNEKGIRNITAKEVHQHNAPHHFTIVVNHNGPHGFKAKEVHEHNAPHHFTLGK